MNRENFQTYLGLRAQYKELSKAISEAKTEEDEDKAVHAFVEKCREIVTFCDNSSAQETEEVWKNDWNHRGDYFRITVSSYDSVRAYRAE